MTNSLNNLQLPDFSRKATRRAVFKESIQHPITMYSGAIGMLGGLAALLFGGNVIALGAAIGGFSLGCGAWLINYFVRHKTVSSRHVERLRRQLEKQKQEVMARLHHDLNHLRAIPGAEDLAEQGGEQFGKVLQKYDNFIQILQQKLETTELAYSRYAGTGEQVYLNVLDNLATVVDTLKSIQTIDVSYINERKGKLAKLKSVTDADRKEMETLEKRLALRNRQIQKVNELLTANEEAMTALDYTCTGIAEMRTVRGKATTGLDQAMTELEELARRARDYSI